MKQSVLGIISTLMASMKGNSRHYHSLLIPLIDSSVNKDSPNRIYLLEDAIDLWATVLQQTPTNGVDSVMPLVPHLFPMLEAGSETLRRGLDITETYFYLAPSQMLASIEMFLPSFVSLLQNAKREATSSILSIVELAVRSTLHLGGHDRLATLTSQLLQSNFLQILLSGLRGAHQAHESSGPNGRSTWLDVLIEADYLSILSRLALADLNMFIYAMHAAVPSEQFHTLIKWLLREWFRHLDNISHPEKKKLNCFALTALLQTGQSWIMEHLQDLMAVWTEVALELYDDDANLDCLIYTDPDAMKGEDETAEQEGQRKVGNRNRDDTITVNERLTTSGSSSS